MNQLTGSTRTSDVCAAIQRLLPACLLLALVAGCSGDTSPTTAPGPSSSAGATASPTAAAPSPSPTGLAAQRLPDVPVPQDLAPFTGPASDEFGADKVMQGYLFATRWALESAFNGTLLGIEKPRAIDMSAPEEAMTAAGAADYRASTAKIEAGTATEDDFTNAFAVSTWGITGLVEGSRLADQPYRDTGFGGGGTDVVEVDGRPALRMTFPIKGVVLLDGPDGKRHGVQLAKDLDLALVQTGIASAPWKVQSWRVSYNLGEPVEEAAG